VGDSFDECTLYPVWGAKEKPPWTINIHVLKNEGQEGKTGLFYRWVPLGVGGDKERVNESEFCGGILYQYMKIEKWSLSKLL
jgi:hypothetical protein